MILQGFTGVQAAALALGEQVAAALRDALAQRTAASIAVPGGRTPVPFFHALRDADLDWSRVHITLTDERWVPEGHDASNAALVRRELLQGRAAAAQFMPLHTDADSAALAAAAVWQSLRALPRPFDAVVLGMGEDGHFASLFPQSPGVAAALDPAGVAACVAMQAPTAPSMRLSLNLAALLQARRLFLFISGNAKRQLLVDAARGDDPAVPIATLLSQRTPEPEVYWAP